MSYKLVLHAGPDLTDARPKANPLVRTPHPLLREKKESVNQFAKIGKLCSESAVIKKFSIIAEVPTITSFVAAFDAKALNCTELLESYLAGMNRIINCNMQTNRNRHNWNIWHNTWSTLFIRITSVFFLSVLRKNKHTAPIQYAWRHKDFKAQREDHVATLLPRL